MNTTSVVMKRAFAWVLLAFCLFAFYFQAAASENVSYRNVSLGKDDTYLDMNGTRISDLEKFRLFLRQYPNLSKVDMMSTRLSVANMEKLMADFPQIDFGCTFSFIRGGVSTRTEGYSTFNRLADPRYPSKKFIPLRHCKHLKALDLGHNEIKDLDFLEPLNDLRILILAQCRIEDISVLSKMENLEYLELFNNKITDLSPLEGLQNLKHLNLCHNPFTDITPLFKLKSLKRLWISKEYLTKEQVSALEAALPDCKFFYAWGDCTGGGWRGEGGYYPTIMRIFKSGRYEPFAD